MHSGDLLDLTLRGFLEKLARDEPAPGGGSAAAIAVAMGAALSAKSARVSTDWSEGASTAAQAERLLRRIAPLAQSDAEAYEEALAALHLPENLESEVRNMALGHVLTRAAEIPLVIAEAGADVAALAAQVADRGAPGIKGDVASAALLAAAGSRAAAGLVALNLTVTSDDERVKRAQQAAEAAADSARSAVEFAAQ